MTYLDTGAGLPKTVVEGSVLPKGGCPDHGWDRIQNLVTTCLVFFPEVGEREDEVLVTYDTVSDWTGADWWECYGKTDNGFCGRTWHKSERKETYP